MGLVVHNSFIKSEEKYLMGMVEHKLMANIWERRDDFLVIIKKNTKNNNLMIGTDGTLIQNIENYKGY